MSKKRRCRVCHFTALCVCKKKPARNKDAAVRTARKKLARAASLHAKQIALRADYHAKHGWSMQIPAGPWHRAVKTADEVSFAAGEAVERAVRAGAKLKEIL